MEGRRANAWPIRGFITSPPHSLSRARPLSPLTFNNAHCLRSTYPNGFTVRSTQIGDVNYARSLFLDGLKRGLLLLFLLKLYFYLGMYFDSGMQFSIAICFSVLSCKSRIIVYLIFMDFCLVG